MWVPSVRASLRSAQASRMIYHSQVRILARQPATRVSGTRFPGGGGNGDISAGCLGGPGQSLGVISKPTRAKRPACLAPVSGRCFSVSILRCPRPARHVLRTGQRAEHQGSSANMVPELYIHRCLGAVTANRRCLPAQPRSRKGAGRPVMVRSAGGGTFNDRRGDSRREGPTGVNGVHPCLPLRCPRTMQFGRVEDR